MTDLYAFDRLRGHSLVPTEEMLAAIPALYETGSVPFDEKQIYLRFFAGGSAEWLIAEVDRAEWLMFGYCDLGLGFPEWGYVNLAELCSIRARSPQGFPIYVERDIYWQVQTFGAHRSGR